MKLACVFVLTFLLWLNTASAEELIMARSGKNFEDAMSSLQATITRHGYKVTRVQRVEVGLQAKGYKTDRYRIVFYGKPGEIEMLAGKYPKLIPYLPQTIVIFAEEDNTIITAAHPALLEQMYPDPELKQIFERWEKDMLAMMDELREEK
jgi:uncharacterized protein (DUF302 family)